MVLTRLKNAIVALGKTGVAKEKQQTAKFADTLQAAMTEAFQDTSKTTVDRLQSLVAVHLPKLYDKFGKPAFAVAAELAIEVWDTRLRPCLGNAEGSGAVREQKELWEHFFEKGIVAGLQDFYDKHPEKLADGEIAKLLYPALTKVIIDDKCTMVSVALRKEVTGLLCDTARNVTCAALLLRDDIFGGARIGEVIADTNTYALLEPLLEMAVRIRPTVKNPKLEPGLLKRCLGSGKLRRVLGDDQCTRLIKAMLKVDLTDWASSARKLIEIMAEGDINRPQPIRVEGIRAWMKTLEVEQPIYVDSDAFLIDIKDNDELCPAEIRFTTIHYIKILESKEGVHRVEFKTTAPPTSTDRVLFDLDGVPDTLKIITFDIAAEVAPRFKNAIEGRRELKKRFLQTRNMSVAGEAVYVPKQAAGANEVTEAGPTSTSHASIVNSNANALLAEAAAASDPIPKDDQWVEEEQDETPAPKKSQQKSSKSKITYSKAKGKGKAAVRDVDDQLENMEDRAASELSDDEAISERPLLETASRKARGAAAPKPRRKSVGRKANETTKQSGSRNTKGKKSVIAESSLQDTPVGTTPDDDQGTVLRARQPRKAAVQAKSRIAEQQSTSSQQLAAKVPLSTEQEPAHIPISANTQSIRLSPVKAITSPDEDMAVSSSNDSWIVSVMDKRNSRRVAERAGAGDPTRSADEDAEHLPTSNTLVGAKRKLDDSETARDIEVDMPETPSPPKKAKVTSYSTTTERKAKTILAMDNTRTLPTSSVTAHWEGSRPSVSIEIDQNMSTVQNLQYSEIINGRTSRGPGKILAAASSRKSRQAEDNEQTPTAGRTLGNTADLIDFPRSGSEVQVVSPPLVREIHKTTPPSQPATTADPHNKRGGTRSGRKQKAPWESKDFNAGEHESKRIAKAKDGPSIDPAPARIGGKISLPESTPEAEPVTAQLSPLKASHKQGLSAGSTIKKASLSSYVSSDSDADEPPAQAPSNLRSAMKNRVTPSDTGTALTDQKGAFSSLLKNKPAELSANTIGLGAQSSRKELQPLFDLPSFDIEMSTTRSARAGRQRQVAPKPVKAPLVKQASSGSALPGQAFARPPHAPGGLSSKVDMSSEALSTAGKNAVRNKYATERIRQKQVDSIRSPLLTSRRRNVTEESALVTTDDEEDIAPTADDKSPLAEISRILGAFAQIVHSAIVTKVAYVKNDAQLACEKIVAHAKADQTVMFTQKRGQLEKVLLVETDYLKNIEGLDQAHAGLRKKNAALTAALKETLKTHESNRLERKWPATLFK